MDQKEKMLELIKKNKAAAVQKRWNPQKTIGKTCVKARKFIISRAIDY